MCWEGTETRVLIQLSFSISRDVGSVGVFALKSPYLCRPLKKLVVFCSWLGMLPGTWAYVSAGAIGRAFIVGSYSFFHSHFFVIFLCSNLHLIQFGFAAWCRDLLAFTEHIELFSKINSLFCMFQD